MAYYNIPKYIHSISFNVSSYYFLLPGTGVTGLCHFDGCNTRQGVEDLVESVLKLGNDGGR